MVVCWGVACFCRGGGGGGNGLVVLWLVVVLGKRRIYECVNFGTGRGILTIFIYFTSVLSHETGLVFTVQSGPYMVQFRPYGSQSGLVRSGPQTVWSGS